MNDTGKFQIVDVVENTTCTKKEGIEKVMHELSMLPDGWDYGVGYAPCEKVIEKSKQILSYDITKEFGIEIRPQTFGGLVITFSKSDYFLDVFISEDLSLSICLEKGVGSDFEILQELEGADNETIVIQLKNIIKLENVAHQNS